MAAVNGTTVASAYLERKRLLRRRWLAALIVFGGAAIVTYWKPWAHDPSYPSALRGIGLPVSVWQHKFGDTPQDGCLYTYCFFNSAGNLDYVDYVEQELHAGTTYSQALSDAAKLLPKDSIVRSGTTYSLNTFSPFLSKYRPVKSHNDEAGWISVCFYPGPDSQGNLSSDWSVNHIRIIVWFDLKNACDGPLIPSNMYPAFQ